MTREHQERIRAVCFNANIDVPAAERRLLLYRRLVRHNLFDVAKNLLSRTREAVENGMPGAFDALFADYLEQASPRSHHLRAIPSEFVSWAAPRMQSEWGGELASLARLEMAEFEAASAEELPNEGSAGELSENHMLVFSNAKRLLELSHSVHEASPVAREVRLLVYRDDECCVRRLELSPLHYRMLERLFEGETLGKSLTHASGAPGTPMSPNVVSDAAALLSALSGAGLVLGVRPPQNGPK